MQVTFDWTISFGNVITLLCLFGSMVLGWAELRNRSITNAAGIRRAEKSIAEVAERAGIAADQAKTCREATSKAELADKKAELLAVECRLLKEQLYEFREKVAGNYVTLGVMGDWRREIKEEFRLISERLDGAFRSHP